MLRKDTRKLMGFTSILKYLAIGVALVLGFGIASLLYKKIKPDLSNATETVVEAV